LLTSTLLNSFDIVDLLLKHNSNIDSKDENENTALAKACLKGNSREMIDYLLSKNASVEAANK